MPTQSTQHSSGTITSPSSVSTISSANGYNNVGTSKRKSFRYRVTGVADNGWIYYESVDSIGRSQLGQPDPNKTAQPLNKYQNTVPKIGEYVDITFAAEPFSAAINKSTPKQIAYYTGPLNIWDNMYTNVSLDQSTPGQIANTKQSNFNVTNYNNSLNGMI